MAVSVGRRMALMRVNRARDAISKSDIIVPRGRRHGAVVPLLDPLFRGNSDPVAEPRSREPDVASPHGFVR